MSEQTNNGVPMTSSPKRRFSWHVFANPTRFLRFSAQVRPWLLVSWMGLLAYGIYAALLVVPADYQQGEVFRILYIHVPTAWVSLLAYALLAACGASLLVWKHPLSALAARAIAPIGALFTALCLGTGMLWGKPTWGAAWVWDARLTSVLVLLFLYIGHMAVCHAFTDRARADHAAALLALVGVVNLPIIKFSVNWWQTLHQPASISSIERLIDPAIDASMRLPLLLNGLGASLLFAWMVLLQTEMVLYHAKATRA
jgi:heme exporter protein C